MMDTQIENETRTATILQGLGLSEGVEGKPIMENQVKRRLLVSSAYRTKETIKFPR